MGLQAVSGPGDSLVGRGEERGRLEALLAVPGQVVLVGGESGIGKTALVAAVAARAEVAGARVAWGVAWDGPGAPALWPWVQVLRSLTGEGLPAAPGPARSRAARFALFDEIARRLGDPCPTLIVVDDVHWADAASLEMLRFLARHRRAGGAAIVATCRLAEARAGPNASIVADLSREAARVDLGPLTTEEVATLVERVAGLPVPPDLRTPWAKLTGGNPLFIVELARLLRNGVDPAELHEQLPPTVRASLLERLDLLAPAVRAVVTAGAVVGATFDAKQATTLARAEASGNQLARAVEVGILEYAPPFAYRFVHPIARAVVLDVADDRQLKQLHLAMAALLEERELGAGERLVAAAGHRSAAYPFGDAATAVELARRAGRLALSSFGFEEAVAWFERAARMASDLPPAVQATAWIDLAEAAARAGDADQATAASRRAAAIAAELGDGIIAARAALASPPWFEGVEVAPLHDAAQVGALVAALADDAVPAELRARLLAKLAVARYWEPDRESLDALAREAVLLARSTGDNAVLGYCLAAALYATWGPDSGPGREVQLAELEFCARWLADPELELAARSWRVVGCLEAGDVAGAAVAMDAAHERAQHVRHPLLAWTVARWDATLALIDGRLDDAESLAASAADIGAQAVDPGAAMEFYGALLGTVRFLQGRLGELQELIEPATKDHPAAATWRCGLAAARTQLGDRGEGLALAEELVRDGAAALPRDLNWLAGVVTLAAVASELRDEGLAHDLLDLLRPYADRWVVLGSGYSTYGPVALALGDLEAVVGGERQAAVHYGIVAADCPDGPFRALAELGLLRLGIVASRSSDELSSAFARWGMLKRAEEAGQLPTARAEAGQPPCVVVRREGAVWTVGMAEGRTVPVPPRKGLAYLAVLVGSPGRQHHVLDLVAAVEGIPAAPIARADPILDDQARHSYRERMLELEAEIAESEGSSDVGRRERLEAELELLQAALVRSLGLGGRPRLGSSTTERARVNVTKHLRRTIEYLGNYDPAVADHLRAAIRTGTECAYLPA